MKTMTITEVKVPNDQSTVQQQTGGQEEHSNSSCARASVNLARGVNLTGTTRMTDIRSASRFYSLVHSLINSFRNDLRPVYSSEPGRGKTLPPSTNNQSLECMSENQINRASKLLATAYAPNKLIMFDCFRNQSETHFLAVIETNNGGHICDFNFDYYKQFAAVLIKGSGHNSLTEEHFCHDGRRALHFTLSSASRAFAACPDALNVTEEFKKLQEEEQSLHETTAVDEKGSFLPDESLDYISRHQITTPDTKSISNTSMIRQRKSIPCTFIGEEDASVPIRCSTNGRPVILKVNTWGNADPVPICC
jgi:hypothetical protein